jgi:hypothetical protein
MVGVAFYEPNSLSFSLIHSATGMAKASMATLAMLATTALLDAIINDLLPDKWTFRTALMFRQTIWFFMGLLFLVHAGVVLILASPFISLIYFGFGVRCISIAILDLHFRTADKKRNRRLTDHGALNA